jgi:putative ABC transport system ATP-binding protein
MPLIEITDLRKEYVSGDISTPVLRGVTCSIEEGEFVAIMGPSGSGKSTLMHIMGFLDHPTSGTYRFGGEDATKMTDDRLAQMRRDKIGFVFQAFFLLPGISVLENVMLPLAYRRLPDAQRRQLADKAIESVGLAHRRDYLATRISGGEKQRTAIARAIVGNPKVVFADEPTGNLDSASGGQVMEILEKLNAAGTTVVLVTHERDTAEHAGRILTIRDGALVGDEKVSQRKRVRDGMINK